MRKIIMEDGQRNCQENELYIDKICQINIKNDRKQKTAQKPT